ncbi:MAG: hypothetical protein ACXWNC_00475 [Anaerolineales bacterium]
MKIIDNTPYYNTETGEITFTDRMRARMKFGSTWIKEAEAQNQIIPVLGKVLDRNYTLLRNATPPGLDASLPFILVGPTGIFVMYVTPITGMFRAKGDQWGTISGDAFKNELPNLLTRTENMARALQLFLQRQGFLLTSVEAVLLCSDLSVNVDSVRPIIRVVMRDALERFAISITQAHSVLSPEAVEDVIRRIMNPPVPALSESPAQEPVLPIPEDTREPDPSFARAFAIPEAPAPVSEKAPDPIPVVETPDLSLAPKWNSDQTPLPPTGDNEGSLTSKGARFNRTQWVLLIAMFVFWALLVGVFLFVVVKDQWSFIRGLLP